ncbi:hypothetical protein FKW77_005091 [Venturia effusa]|uniref:CBM6 domain-containing protein n=1 Tax=Venturia effusa TaxID=50376 RepID=A0A517L1A3_9PEZI|nr:hypothetical protein FKW77_005091 [Venturia effusa]
MMVHMTRLKQLLLFATSVSAKWIVPGARWRDTDGNLVNAHAGGVTIDQNTGKFYLFGEYKVQGQVEGGGVSVYSSDDLATWTHHGLAQSDNIAGPYSFVDATAPLGNWSQDFGLFVDHKDGSAYSLYSNGDWKDGRDVYITSFNKNITGLDAVVHRFDKFDLEAPAIIQTDKSYFALMSHKTGYRPNNVVAFRADKLSGPWSQPFIIAPLNTRTYNSQSGNSLRIKGTEQTTYLYLGDQWDSVSLWESRCIWLPMEIDEEKKSLKLQWHDVYDLNVKTGKVTPITGTTYYGKDATTTGNAFKQEATFGSHGIIVTGIYGNDSKVSFSGIEGQGKPQWVSFYYQNTDDMGFGDQAKGAPDRINGTWQMRRISSVIVNNKTDEVTTLYQRDTHKGIILSTPLLLDLKKGKNVITIGGLFNKQDVKGADIDRLVVYPPEE